MIRICGISALLLLAGCAAASAPAVVDTSCQAFEPITYSRRDTPETVAQIRQHNAAWVSLCK